MAAAPHSSGRPTLVIVSGAGRSGTSTMAGALKYLGLSIPTPEVAANKANPRGYFEPRWVVDFHKRLLGEANVVNADAQPDCMEQVAAVSKRADVRDELREWLAGQMHQPQVVVKDPRAFMFFDLWLATVEDLGMRPVFLSMLRNPPEVCGSQGTYYLGNRSAAQRRLRESGNLARWTNATLLNEQLTRGHERVFVRYADLLENWRATAGMVARALDLQLNSDLDPDEHHPVDDFIDVKLHRVKVTWDDLDVPDELHQQAEMVWQILSAARPVDGQADPVSASDAARLDEVHAVYQKLHYHAAGIAHDRTQAAVRKARADADEAAAKKLRAVREQLAQARSLAEAHEESARNAQAVAAAAEAAAAEAIRRAEEQAAAQNPLSRSAAALARKARAFRAG